MDVRAHLRHKPPSSSPTEQALVASGARAGQESICPRRQPWRPSGTATVEREAVLEERRERREAALRSAGTTWFDI